MDKFRHFLAEFDDSTGQPADGSTPGFEQMMTSVHAKYRQQRALFFLFKFSLAFVFWHGYFLPLLGEALSMREAY